jgi:hypothetical protein
LSCCGSSLPACTWPGDCTPSGSGRPQDGHQAAGQQAQQRCGRRCPVTSRPAGSSRGCSARCARPAAAGSSGTPSRSPARPRPAASAVQRTSSSAMASPSPVPPVVRDPGRVTAPEAGEHHAGLTGLQADAAVPHGDHTASASPSGAPRPAGPRRARRR